MPRTQSALLGPTPLALALALLAGTGTAPVGAQATVVPPPVDTLRVDSTAPTAAWGALVTLGGLEDDRRRVDQLLGRSPIAPGQLLRSASTLTRPLRSPSGKLVAQLLLPEARGAWNSGFPFSLNDGAMWAGRGASFQLSGGFRASWGRVRATVAPVVVFQQNRETDYFPYPTRERSRFAFPWTSNSFDPDPYSIDLPSRFGDEAFWTVDPGQTTLSVDVGPLSLGASTEEQWWGPGVRNALLLSNNAAGIPRLFLRTERPLRTRVGELEGHWISGALTESAYFDTTAFNDVRSLSAAAIVFRPAVDMGLSLGAARAVYREVDGVASVPGRALDAWITRVGAASEIPPSDPRVLRGPDQVVALFGRWAIPRSGLEVYAEWALRDIPSLRQFLTTPNRSQGYTVGAQWARTAGAQGSALRLQAEATFLEQNGTAFLTYVAPWYQSRLVPQGYTQRGQSLGAGIGPGSSSQWLAADRLTPRWQAGVFAGRIRWQDDFHPFARPAPSSLGHDVSVFAGLRGAVRMRAGEVWAEYTGATRYNMFYQYRSTGFREIDAVDRRNHTFRLGVTPRAGS